MKEYFKSSFGKDFLSSLVVFLVALPLCMGIALASGAPIVYGLISGVIGGLVVGAFTGSPLQVSGPAAGLAVIVFDIIQKDGLGGLAIITFFAGLFQVSFAFLKAGPLFRAISPSVVKGMLAGIGVLIFASQFHVMVDDNPASGAWENLITIPSAVAGIFSQSGGAGHTQAGLLGIFTIALIVGWNIFKAKVKNPVPGPLVGVLAASLAVFALGLDIKLVELPQNLTSVLDENLIWKRMDSFEWGYLASALMVAFIATTETLLCVTAVDRLKPGHESDYNKELFAQGAGNTVAGILGALPLTGVIVRTSANVEAGGQTRGSTFMHGLWLFIVLFFFPFILSYIPKAGLAAILVYTGYKLMDFKVVKTFNKYGYGETAIYFATIGGVVFINLLAGVALGFALSLARLIWKTHHGKIEKIAGDHETRFVFEGSFSFVNLPKVASVLEQGEDREKIVFDLRHAYYVDHAIDELIEGVRKGADRRGKQVKVLLSDIQRERADLAKEKLQAT